MFYNTKSSGYIDTIYSPDRLLTSFAQKTGLAIEAPYPIMYLEQGSLLNK